MVSLLLVIILFSSLVVVGEDENSSSEERKCGLLDIPCWLSRISNMIEEILKWPLELPESFINVTKNWLEEQVNATRDWANLLINQTASPFTRLFLGVPADSDVFKELGLEPSPDAKYYILDLGEEFSSLMDLSLKIAYGLLGLGMLIAFAAYILERGIETTTALRILRRGIITIIFLPLVKYIYHMIVFIVAEFEAWVLPPVVAWALFAPLSLIGLITFVFVPALLLFLIAMVVIAATRLLIFSVLTVFLPVILALECMPWVNGVATRLRNLFISSFIAVIIGVFAFRIGIIAIRMFTNKMFSDPATALVGMAIMFAAYATPLIVSLFGGGGAVVAVGSFIAGYITGTLQKIVQSGQKAIKTAMTAGTGGAGATAGASTRITETTSSFTPRIKPENTTLLLGEEQE